MAFEHLQRPGRINRLELRNRIVMPAMHLGLSRSGDASEALIAFYRQRARGGAGLIIVGGMTVGPEAGGEEMITLSENCDVEGLRRLTAAVRGEGARIGAQLYHAGRYAHSGMLRGLRPLAPSAVASTLTKETPLQAGLAEILRLQSEFAAAALRAVEAGFDAVEIIASAGYLISQFLSPLTNRRTDEYGGSLEQRMRFGLEVAAEVRSVVGPSFPVIFRIGGSDFMPGGNTLAESRRFARALQEQGVDAISVTGGWHETRVPQIAAAVPRGGLAYLAREIRDNVEIPVLVANRINKPADAEQLLRLGYGDFVCMGRAFIADPDFPAKMRDPALGPIRSCTGCGCCFDQVIAMEAVRCTVNPRVGHEAEPLPSRTVSPRRVVIVGGGPAGLMAAVSAARAGHRVTVLERMDACGGQIRLAARVPGRADFGLVVASLIAEAIFLGVEIRSGETATAERVRQLQPDVLILATGAAPASLSIPGVDLPHVVHGWDVLAGRIKLAASRVVIVGGGATGLDLARYLAEEGTLPADVVRFLLLEEAEQPASVLAYARRGAHHVTVVEERGRVGRGMGRSARWAQLCSLERFGVELLPRHKVESITREGVLVRSILNGKERTLPADAVILAAGVTPAVAAHDELAALAPRVLRAGDCVHPGNAFDAIRSGLQAAIAIDQN